MPSGQPPVFPVTTIDDPALPEVLVELAAARASRRGRAGPVGAGSPASIHPHAVSEIR
jgi:hypothetical protein